MEGTEPAIQWAIVSPNLYKKKKNLVLNQIKERIIGLPEVSQTEITRITKVTEPQQHNAWQEQSLALKKQNKTKK